MSQAHNPLRTVLVTRPAHQAASLMTALAARGYAPIAAPVLKCVPSEADYPARPYQAIIFTSANGVGAFAARDPRRDFTVYAVGEATAAAARRALFTRIVAGHAGAAALSDIILRDLPAGARVLYPSARDAAFDMEAALAGGAIIVDRVVAYAMEAEDGLTEKTLSALETDCVALFYSRRTLGTFLDLTQAAGRSTGHVTAVVVGAEDTATEPEAFARIVTVPHPAGDQDVLDALDRLEGVKGGE